MTALFIVLLMVAIGAMIGAITNSIAIKMLFRPYKAIYIRNWRLPFTPGLIPKRRVELADQLGKLVVNHLLTAEGLKKKLESTTFINEMTDWLSKEASILLKSEKNLDGILCKWLNLENSKHKLEKNVEKLVMRRIDTILEEIRPLYLKEVLPEKISEQVDQYIPTLTTILIERSRDYFKSEDGIERLSNMVDRFLVGRGTIGNMISMFLGNDRLVDKIQPEVIKMLEDEGTHELIEDLIRKEWKKIQSISIEEFEQKINVDDLIILIQETVKKNVPLDYFDRPLSEWAPKYEHQIIGEMVPKLVNSMGQAASNEIVHLLKKLHLEEVVKNQVEQFSVERLEDIVLSISKRELKLITYLGGLLGGLIGLIQGVALIFLQ